MQSGSDGTALQWKALYEAALLETNPGRIPRLIMEAEHAVINRMAALASSDDSAAEKHALMDALNALRDLRRLTRQDCA
ncbi:MAG TPA: hypothetical protein VF011_01155 [Terriglobales bacterium]